MFRWSILPDSEAVSMLLYLSDKMDASPWVSMLAVEKREVKLFSRECDPKHKYRI